MRNFITPPEPAAYPEVTHVGVDLERVALLAEEIAYLFVRHDTRYDWPRTGYVRFRGRFLRDPADAFDALRAHFEVHGFTPMIREEEGHRVLIGMPLIFRPGPSNWTINLVLFIATVFSTLLVGASSESENFLANLWAGWPFSVSLLAILGAHELGHYFAARYHRVPVTLPYFIPLPLPGITPIGTLGAFIRLKAPVKNRRALLDVGAAGPLAGLVVAIPVLLYGLATSDVGDLPVSTPYLLEGNSLLYALAKIVVFGQMLPAGGIDVQLNQVAWAGWVGLLVTGLNLIPVGQLDGGHAAYVLWGRRAAQLYWPVIFGLIVLMFVTGTGGMWGLWVMLLFFFGRQYAQPLDDVTPLDGRRRAIAILTLVIFILVFVPAPLRVIFPPGTGP